MTSINATMGLNHAVERKFIFRDVVALYRREGTVKECPISIMFVDEIAVDMGARHVLWILGECVLVIV